ncbi:tetratricopeptide repeat protein [archaeon]|nr:tetratricopeptide repeat protein [archaeon]
MLKAILGIIHGVKSRKLIQKGEWKKALPHIEKALEEHPLDTGYLVDKGVVLWKLGKHNESIECFDMAILRYKNFKEDLFYFGGDTEENLKANYISALNNKGSLFAELGENKKARELHQLALKLDKNRKSAMINLKNDYINEGLDLKGDLIDSIGGIHGEEVAKKIILEEVKQHDKVLKIEPKNIIVLVNKGVALAELDKFKDSIKCYDKALKIEPKNKHALKCKKFAKEEAKKK